MRRLLLSLLGVIVSITFVNAGKVTKQQALQKAQQFMKGRNLTPANTKSLCRGESSEDAFFIFNAEDKGGYVIVSADDRTIAILGYSDKGTISNDDMPENMRTWLQGYAEQIAALPDDYQSNRPHKTRAISSPIEPLIQTTWNQYAPYNLMCPTVGEEHCLTGCVATALAQVMYYYTWPESSPALPAYSTLDELPATTFKWDKMKLNYSYKETGESADAVAELLRYCGQINAMNYGVQASAAYLHVSEIISLFNYSKNTRAVSRSGFTNSQWEDLIIKELEAKRPVLYDGQSSQGGHQFICDGFDGNGLFHINWGWGSAYDGYFVLSLADPYENGIGGGNGGSGFSSKQSAVLGFKPATENEAWIPQMSSCSANVNTTDYSRSSASQDFENVVLKGQLTALFSGVPETTQTVETGWGLYKDGTLLSCLGSESRTIDATEYSYVSNGMTLSFGADLENGPYQLCQIFRMPGETDWRLCDDSGIYYLIAEISETALTLRVPDTNTVDFKVNSISYSEDPEKDSPIEVTVNMTNTSESVLQNVYFWIQVDGQWQKVASNSSAADPNASEDVRMSFTPTYAGTFDVKVTSDSEGSEVKGTGSLTIADYGKVTSEGITYTYNMLTKKAKVKGADNETLAEDVVIPPSISDGGVSYSVTTIADGAFANVNKVVSLVISEGVKTIGNSILGNNNYSLKKLDLPSTITQIDEYAFGGCYNLSTLIVRMAEPFAIDENVFSLINWVKNENTDEWESVTSFTKATLCVPVGMTSKYQNTGGWNAFQTIVEGEIKEVTIDGLTYRYVTGPKTATLINGEISDADLTIPSSITVEDVSYSVKAIANSVFRYKNIVSLVVSEGVETIGEMAFAYCYSLKTVDFPSTLKQIGDKAFCGYSNLSKVTVRMAEPFVISDHVFCISSWVDGVETFSPSQATLCVPVGTTSKYQNTDGWKAFQTIVEGEIKEVTIDGLTYSYATGPKTATVIKGETSDTDLTIPSSITVEDVPYAVKAIGKSAFIYKSNIVNLIISEGIETIGEEAFLYCNGLKTVDLPSTLKQIDEKAFCGCNYISRIVVRMTEPFAISDHVFSASKWENGVETLLPPSATLCVPIGTSSKYQTTDGWKAFQTMVEGEIKEVTIDGLTYSYATGPKTATLIKGEFSGTDLTIPSSITVDGVSYSVKAIANSVFRYNNNIVSLVVSEGVETIGEMAFANSYTIKTVILPSTLKQMDEKAFGSCSYLSKIVVRMTEPLAINENVFSYTKSVKNEETGEWESVTCFTEATLYVPEGTLSKYQEADVWKKFSDIVDKVIEEGRITPPTAVSGLVYSGSAQNLINEGSSDTGTIQYSLDSWYYTTDIPQGTDAKDYTVYYKVVAKEGYLDIAPASLTVTISSKTVSNPTITLSATSFVYDGTAKEPTVTVKDSETTIPASEYTVSYSNNTEVGTATVTIADVTGGNYTVSGSTTFEITKDDSGEGDIETSASIKISAAKQVPYCSDQNLDFTDKPDLKAYVATGYDKATGTIWLTRVKQVPANTGFLLMGDAGDYDIPVAESAADCYYKNMFKGTISGETIYTTDGDYTNYYLSNGEYGVGFYKVGSSVDLKANRAYLSIPTNIPAAGSEGDTEVIKVGAALQVPYYTSKNLDFTSMDAQGVKAYTATGYNYGTGTIWLTRVKKVPAKTGVLVMADAAGEYSIPTASVSSVYENMFVGSESAQTIYDTETINGVNYVNYYLSKGEYGVGFYKAKADGVSMGNNRCYLQVPYRDKVSGVRGDYAESAPVWSDIIVSDDIIAIPVYGSNNGEDDGTTNVQSSMFNVQSADVYYNLQGLRVERPGKGIYIRNGKKVVIK